MTLEEAKKKIKALVQGCSHYKIGKTGKTLADKFDAEYKNSFDRISIICNHNSDKAKIDSWEKALVTHFKASDPRCVNETEDSGEMSDEAGLYTIYIVIKK